MPIDSNFISCGEIVTGRLSGTPFSHDKVRTYARKFLVIYTNKSFGPVEICQCPGLPLPYSPYIVNTNIGTSDLSALCVKISSEAYKANNEGEWGKAIVTCEYSTDLGEDGVGDGSNFPNNQNGQQNNPELEPPEISWDFEEKTKSLPYDLDGQPFVNSAGVPISPAPLFETASAILTITRNELQFYRKKASQYAYSLNDKEFLEAPKGSAQCLPPKATAKFLGRLPYWRVTYRIRFAYVLPDLSLASWQPEFVDNGLQQLVLKPGKNPALEDKKKPRRFQPDLFEPQQISAAAGGGFVSEPVLLDGNGGRLLPDPLAGNTLSPVKLQFQVYRYQDFTQLFARGVR